MTKGSAKRIDVTFLLTFKWPCQDVLTIEQVSSLCTNVRTTENLETFKNIFIFLIRTCIGVEMINYTY